MRGYAEPSIVRRLKWRLYLPSVGGKKRLALVMLVVGVAVMVAAGLAQVFRFDFTPEPSQGTGAPALEWREVMSVLNRYGTRPSTGNETIALDVLLATPQYFGALRRQTPPSVVTEPSLLFYVTETTHIDDLPSSPPEPRLRIGNATYSPADTTVLADSYHHRSTMVRFAVGEFGEGALDAGAKLEMVFPALEGVQAVDNVVEWELPLMYSDEYASTDVVVGGPDAGIDIPAVSGVAVLAVLGGLLAAMWPCLFQLTAYFIPAMAGMSMQNASQARGLRPKVGVVKIAFFFVLGFTIIYTLAGAVIGYGSQQLSNMGGFYVWQRYLSIAAGVVLFALALRVAARARAPLVCKMPVLSRSAKKGVTSPWESMLVGITFATGCMTCFGSAVLIGMVLYVGLAGSPLVGATLLFLFSLGMGVPLVAGAIAMARVLPMLFKIEKALPWMGLASAVLIAGYGVLLITGNFMAVTRLVYGVSGVAALP